MQVVVAQLGIDCLAHVSACFDTEQHAIDLLFGHLAVLGAEVLEAFETSLRNTLVDESPSGFLIENGCSVENSLWQLAFAHTNLGLFHFKHYVQAKSWKVCLLKCFGGEVSLPRTNASLEHLHVPLSLLMQCPAVVFETLVHIFLNWPESLLLRLLPLHLLLLDVGKEGFELYLGLLPGQVLMLRRHL